MTSNDTPRTPGDEDLTRDDDLTQPLEPVEVTDEQDEAPAAPADAGSSDAGSSDAGSSDADAGTPGDAGAVGVTAPLPARDDTLVLPTTGTTRPLDTSVPTPAADRPADAPRTPAATTAAARDQARPGDGASAAAEHRPTLRVGTVVWGLVLAAIGVGVLAWAGGASIDVQLATIVLLAAAGTALLVGSLVSSARRRR